MRIQSLLLLIPSITGLFWLLAYLVYSPRDDYFRKLKRFIAVLSLFFLFAFLSANTGSKMMLHYVLFEQVCALAIVPCFLSYIRTFRNTLSDGFLLKICSFAPFLQLVVGIETVYTVGFDKSLAIYLDSLDFVGPMFPYLDDKSQIVFYASYTYVFKTFLLINFLLFAINMMSSMIREETRFGQIFRFIFSGHRCSLIPVQYFLALVAFLIIITATVLGKGCYSGSVVITAAACILIAAALTVLSLVGAAGPMDKHSLPEIIDLIRSGKR